ncbi:hypothetical protein ILUMI_15129 [Ignelater luminosus]|uniref:Uncharacterized protein n=1 Tax=Ignelater luminosus TaxID=2038154 RepID=A0A8K0GA89_IGNLU|nr:hypothetical protein ILUMI_15129 [Ignelater luminosus]
MALVSEVSALLPNNIKKCKVKSHINQIPIATLNSVNQLLQSTRRLRLNNRANQQIRAARTPTYPPHYFQGPKVQADGSSSRVLLNI